MDAATQTTAGTPRPYHRPIAASWWLKYPAYTRFMLRELSCVFIGAYAAVLLVMLYRLSQGKEAYDDFLAALKSPVAIAFHVIALAFAVLHTVTWFNATPQAMAVRLGEKRVPSAALVGMNYIAWLVVSLVVFWAVTRGA